MSAGTRLPAATPLRVVGDVHGDARGLAAALATERFVVQLGDLVDHGSDSAGCLSMMLDRVAAGRGMFLLGNHEFKLVRALSGLAVQVDPALAVTLDALDQGLRERARAAIARAPAWARQGGRFFVHAGFHTAMLAADPPPLPPLPPRARGVLARALYGEPTGRTRADGFPERSLRWVDRIPPGLVVYCGHDRRSSDGRPHIREGAAGGRAVFLDTGAGKGGHLSWIDLPAEED